MHIPAARDNDRVGYFVISTFKVVNLFSSNGAWLKIVEECLAVDKHAVYAQSCLMSFIQSVNLAHLHDFTRTVKIRRATSCMIVV